METLMNPVAIHKRGVRFFIDKDTQCPMKNCPPHWYFQWWTRKYKHWEPRTFLVFDTFLDGRRSFIDVGAWIGPTVLYAAAKAKHVYCFEPDPEAYRVLMRNLVVNPQYSHITVVHAALSDQDGTTPFGGNGELGNSESTMLVRDPDYGKKQGQVLRTGDRSQEEAWRTSVVVQVPTISMETFQKMHDVHDCALMKIDIEGGEKIVVPAIESFLRSERPTLYLSIHWMYLSQDEIEGLFALLSSIYPVIYDDTLLHRMDKECLIREQVSAIVCCVHPLTFLQHVHVYAMTCVLWVQGMIHRLKTMVHH